MNAANTGSRSLVAVLSGDGIGPGDGKGRIRRAERCRVRYVGIEGLLQ